MSNRLVGLDDYLKFDRPNPRKLRLDATPDESKWRLHIQVDQKSKNAEKTEDTPLVKPVAPTKASTESASRTFGQLPDVPLLLNGSDKGYPYDSTTNTYHQLDATPDESEWRLHIQVDQKSKNAEKTEDTPLVKPVAPTKASTESASRTFGQLPDVPLLLNGSDKGYPYDSTTNTYHQYLPGDAYRGLTTMNYQRESPLSKAVRTVYPYNPFNKVEPHLGREAPPEMEGEVGEDE
ncbi:uncharacterized protein LOC142338075 [Convolutriloba macropyga]|uniref:uncharacterized protein LOC142338075 n=1 Tax=Convolutriloba macropyga TaxID=536237 RepID=UPI003F520F58